MKYIVVLGDGMADRPVPELNGKTPLELAKKPNIDSLCKKGLVGMVKTVPEGMKPGSDVANLSVIGYDPKSCYSGRSPLEALSIGVNMNDTDIALRTNLVTLSCGNLNEATMVDYSAGEISTAEAKELISAISNAFGNDILTFYAGVSYRHCLIWDRGSLDVELTPPHDISGQKVCEYLPKGNNADVLRNIIEKSYDVLKNHPVNQKRIAEGKNPATHVWFWGAGTKPCLDNFYELYGIKGGIISAVDLLKGIAKGAGMVSVEVDGATGGLDTNWKGKADAALKAILVDGLDYIYIHMEAPDEMGHQGSSIKKIKAIEFVDQVVGWLLEGLNGVDFRMAILPDHPTPIVTKTHASEAVPYIIYDSLKEYEGRDSYTEKQLADGTYFASGTDIIKALLRG